MRRILVRAIMVIAALAVVPSAQAAFVLELSSIGFATVVITDNVAPDTNAATNSISLTTPYSYAGYNIITSVSASYSPGNPANIQQSLLNVTNVSGANPLIVTAYNTLTPATGNTTVQTFLTTQPVAIGNVASATTDTGVNGTFYSSASLTANQGVQNATGTAVSGLVVAAPFTFANRVTFTIATGSNIDVQATSVVSGTPLNTVPAPSALLLIGLGVPAMGLIRRWTRKANAEPALA